MKFNVAEMGHVVNLIPPVDITGGKTGDVFSLANYAHATIVVQVGVSAAAFTKIIVEECSDFAGAGAAAIPFNLHKEETTLDDTLSVREVVTAAGYTPSANDNIFYVIEIDAAELSEGKQFVQLRLTNGTNSVIASAIAVLSGSRYAGDQSPTVIA